MNTAHQNKVRGMKSALNPSLTDLAETWLKSTNTMKHVTGEDLRVYSGLTAKTPHAWGATVNALIRRGALVPTGRYIPMAEPRSHARKTQVYMVSL